jgi:hypothetical protein
VRSPVAWDTFDAVDDDRLRIFYAQAGSGEGPGAAIAEVVLSESLKVVSVSLFERELVGLLPDATGRLREEAAAVFSCLEIKLAQPLAGRRVIDGSPDALLRVYNVWDSGRGRSRESQSATSGMAVEELEDGSRRYSCNDIGLDPDFSKLVFRLSISS